MPLLESVEMHKSVRDGGGGGGESAQFARTPGEEVSKNSKSIKFPIRKSKSPKKSGEWKTRHPPPQIL